MDAKKCDICGKFYEGYPEDSTPAKSNVCNTVALYNFDYGVNGGRKYDLCEECMLELIELFQNRGYAKQNSFIGCTEKYIRDNYAKRKR